jgi:hypothetical protein
MFDTGYWMLDTGYWILDVGFISESSILKGSSLISMLMMTLRDGSSRD